MQKLFAAAILAITLSCASAQAQKVELALDSSEADASVAILQKEAAGAAVEQSDWQALFASEPYQRLKAREASVNASFTDDSFKTFLSGKEMIAQAQDLERVLQTWKRVNFTKLGERVLTYLPTGAEIHAKVYPEIKPYKNSFVWGDAGQRAIFLYLNTSMNQAQFENKVAHECHHIGLDSLDSEQNAVLEGLSEAQKKAVRWLGGFGEGEAMLAAAGSPTVHPHAEDDQATRARWDHDMGQFNENLAAVQQFLLDILSGKLTEERDIMERAQPFYGVQGAWYTVGYKMASMVEITDGRQALLGAMIDPRKLLVLYNQAAGMQNQQTGSHLALWSPELIQALGARQLGQ
ncbi:MAG TPA: DUF5700 domain-containing putative Zn-dependent protease [Candidatus Acidoferrales bacterium]|nr:DUF5700 domain-containing putative Zn-dependent protease [Candidatus Acidoferrales bacterium]